MNDEEYQQAYDKAAAELEAAAQATTARGPDGRFAKAAEPETPAPTPEPTPAPTAAPAVEEVKEPPKAEEDPLAEIKQRLEKAEKMAKDNQAYATRMAQEAARLRKEQEQREREANKPAILDTNPGLAEAIRYVQSAPQPPETNPQQAWLEAVDKAHPGIFQLSNEDELVSTLLARREKSGGAWDDPLVAIREITEEKLALAERQIGKRFTAESAKLAQKSAMSVPGAGAGSGVKAPVDVQLAEVQRIQNMSPADFEKEVRRVKGF